MENLTATYVRILLIEAVIVIGLWWFGHAWS